MICPVCSYKNENVFSLVSKHELSVKKVNLKYEIYHCPDCNSEFAQPMKPAPKEYYDNSDEYYGWRWEFEQAKKDIDENLKEGDSILEIGCGKGIFLSQFTDKYKVYGIDLNSIAIKFAKIKIPSVYDSSLEEFIKNNPNMQFNNISFFNLLEHVDSPSQFIGTLNKLLKKDGNICISIPNVKRIGKIMQGKNEIWDYPPHHLVRYTEKGIKALLNSNGFEIIRISDEPQIRVIYLIISIEETMQKILYMLKLSNLKILKIILKPIIRLLIFFPLTIYNFILFRIKSEKLKNATGCGSYIFAKKK